MKIPLTIIFLLLLALSSFGQSSVQTFDKYVESARRDWNVPGLSIVVVQDGKVLLSKGYGLREVGKEAKVDAETLFGCMSTTKAMTVVAMAMLVDEGKVNWDDKVTKYLPGFRVDDSYVTGDVRVRDLLTHNTGIGNADFLWAWTPELTSNEVVRRMQFAKQAYPLRGGFVYQNIMYLVAGQVIEKVSGIPWERFITERIFRPLDMKNTFANYTLSMKYVNRSVAHFEIKGKIQPIPEDSADPIGPAGSVWSTSDDIGKWVNFMLGNTTVNGKQLLKPETFKELFRPQVVIPPNGGFYPTTALTKPHWTTYALGWFQHDYRGEMVNFHTGSLDGRTAIIGLIPDKKIGVYIFGNLDHAEVRHALMYEAFDQFGFGDSPRDWSKETKALYDGLKADSKNRAEAVKARRVPNTKPSLSLNAYTGKYADPFYGTMEVAQVAGRLRIKITNDLSADLDHWHFDSFRAIWNKSWWDEDIISFELNPVTGTVESMNVGGAVLKRVN
ncbi:MAG: serine hydrolase [Pyrinomonadaceae bacterium]